MTLPKPANAEVETHIGQLDRMGTWPITRILSSFAAEDIASEAVIHFEPYEAVHRSNIAAVKAALYGRTTDAS